MTGKRLWQTIRLCTIMSSANRTEYLRKKRVFGAIGDNCNIQSRKVPLYARLIKLGNNVKIASNVSFVTHDVTHNMLNSSPLNKNQTFQEKVGCIEIKDNVFIGSGTTILYDVRIGENVIVGAGSLINRDIPPNSVVAGTPARVVCSLDEYISKRKEASSYPLEYAPENETISEALIKWCWSKFYSNRD